jgi:hypothetical protein
MNPVRNLAKALLAVIALALHFVITEVAAQSVQSRTRMVRPVSIVGDLSDITRAIDERDSTRAAAGTSRYVGLSVTADVGEQQNIVGVIQQHGRWPGDYPGRYRVEVSDSLRGRWVWAFEGDGSRGESRATFEPVRGRFVRITATDRRGGGDDWSIAELRVLVDQRDGPGFPDRDRDRGNVPEPRGDRGIRDLDAAFDRNPNTRATSGEYDYAGSSLTFDLGGEFELFRVVQIHGAWPEDYPAEYKIEVGRERNDRMYEVWRGRGEPNQSVAQFRPVRARYVRITALRSRDRYHWWSIAEIRTNRDQASGQEDDDQLSGRPIRRISGQGISNASAIIDDNNTTRATTGGINYAGASLTVELERADTVSRVIQIHNPDEDDYPGRYRVEVSFDERRWQKVWEGRGTRGRSAAEFAPVRARFIRITAISNHDLRHWWSIYRLRVRG